MRVTLIPKVLKQSFKYKYIIKKAIISRPFLVLVLYFQKIKYIR